MFEALSSIYPHILLCRCYNGVMAHTKEQRAAWLAANPDYYKNYRKTDKSVEGNRAWLDRNPDYHREYDASRQEQKRARQKKYRDANAEAARQRVRDWHEANPDYARAEAARRRAMKANIDYVPFTIAEMLERWGTCCHICGEEVSLRAPRTPGAPGWERGLHVEHVIGVVNGGPHNLDNCKPAHALCNLQKSKY